MTQPPEHRLHSLGLKLPLIVMPAGNLLGFKIDRGQVFVSGQLPLEDGVRKYSGKVGESISRDTAYEAAKLAALKAISQLSEASGGDLSKIAEITKLLDFVSCAVDFTDIAFFINGASDLVEVFGDLGRHGRLAIGVASHPRGIPVEVELIARLRDEG
ncbi:MAG: RidA family protein [Mesorhizobium sp.]|uniref:RidA family protein n=1 Tax=Mesorhizobium sp. TaxID=1871066 RepID=UPI000FE69E6A|nr:RidA family protein [Mesorhizobium sp.]RWE76940.1 MAG: RidA family protein [Mesorhizobium sp.]TJW58367.1 MAG: RidA family protein [Mesorhizobium sp.]